MQTKTDSIISKCNDTLKYCLSNPFTVEKNQSELYYSQTNSLNSIEFAALVFKKGGFDFQEKLLEIILTDSSFYSTRFHWLSLFLDLAPYAQFQIDERMIILFPDLINILSKNLKFGFKKSDRNGFMTIKTLFGPSIFQYRSCFEANDGSVLLCVVDEISNTIYGPSVSDSGQNVLRGLLNLKDYDPPVSNMSTVGPYNGRERFSYHAMAIQNPKHPLVTFLGRDYHNSFLKRFDFLRNVGRLNTPVAIKTPRYKYVYARVLISRTQYRVQRFEGIGAFPILNNIINNMFLEGAVLSQQEALNLQVIFSNAGDEYCRWFKEEDIRVKHNLDRYNLYSLYHYYFTSHAVHHYGTVKSTIRNKTYKKCLKTQSISVDLQSGNDQKIYKGHFINEYKKIQKDKSVNIIQQGSWDISRYHGPGRSVAQYSLGDILEV